ncbi:MAG: RnfABCDGE type electron transport complex subunit C, partial [Traorella sp.]
MSLFRGTMRTHLDGHKDLSEHKDVITLNPSKVAIPLYAGAQTNPEVLVQVGDEVKVGTKIAQFNGNFIVPIYSSVSGKVEAIEDRMHQTLKKLKHVVISNDMQYVKESNPTIDYEKATKEELVDFMMNAGIIGCGGAGFPTYVKYKFAKNIDKLIINAVECEPYITADIKLIESDFQTILVGIKAMKKMSEAKEVLIAIKQSHPETIKLVEEALKDEKDIKCVTVPDVYPMGWERTLVYQLTKKRYDRLPSEVGCVVNNSTTAYWFAKAMLNGENITSRILTVSGDGVKNPCNVLTPIGSSVKDVVDACGGYTADDMIVCFGGPMMGATITTDA